MRFRCFAGLTICLTLSKCGLTLCVRNHGHKCQRESLSDIDSNLFASPDSAGHLLYNLTVLSKDGNNTIFITNRCAKDATVSNSIRVGFQNIAVKMVDVPPLHVDELACKVVDDIWFLASDHNHGQDNMFEDLIATWYPLFLTAEKYHHVRDKKVRVTHVGGNVKGFLAFAEVYKSLGEYRPWPMLLSGGTTHGKHAAGCVTFRTAIVGSADWSWMDVPIENRHNRQLIGLARKIMENMAAENPSDVSKKVHECSKSIVYASRGTRYRRVVNRDDLIASLRGNFSAEKVSVTEVETSSMSFAEQVQLMSQTDIFITPHGGAGPLVLFLPQGSVVIEIFPFGFADPMYRNMAIMTGKTYFAWQNDDFSKAVNFATLERSSDTIVDVPAIVDIVRMALGVSHGNTGKSFRQVDGRPFNRTYNFGTQGGGPIADPCE